MIRRLPPILLPLTVCFLLVFEIGLRIGQGHKPANPNYCVLSAGGDAKSGALVSIAYCDVFSWGKYQIRWLPKVAP